MKRILCLAFITFLLLLALASCALPHTHSYGEWEIFTQPGCTSVGEEKRTCECGESELREIAAKGHNFNTEEFAATCTDAGYQIKVCSCGESIKFTLDAKGHDFSEWSTEKEATCTENGALTRYCKECDKKETQAVVAQGHRRLSDWTVLEYPTCTTDGREQRECQCGYTTKRPIRAKGHKAGEWVNIDPTCTEDGSKNLPCNVCGELISTIIMPAKGHTNSEWIIDNEATCTESGSKHQFCTVCSETVDTVAIPAKGHTNSEWITDKEATCTESGSKHQSCTVCSETVNTAAIPANGHTSGEWITDKEATCIEIGTKHSICVICEESVTSTIPFTEHNYKGPTCVECRKKRIIRNFLWQESFDETHVGYRMITILVGEEYQLKYSADITDGLFYDLSCFVFYEPYVVDEPSVISIDENGKIKGLKTGLVGIKNTGAIISGSDNPDDFRLYINVISEYTESEYNDTLSTADVIKPGQTIKFSFSSSNDVDVFKFTAPSSFVKIICTYHGDYDGAPSGGSRIAYVQVLTSDGTKVNSGSNMHDSGGDVYERTAYVYTSTGYIIFEIQSSQHPGLFPSGYFTIEIVAK